MGQGSDTTVPEGRLMRGIFNRMYVNICGKSGIVDEGLYGQRFAVVEGCAGGAGTYIKVRTDYGYEGYVKGCDVIMDDCADSYREATGRGECSLVQVTKAVADIMSEPAVSSVRLMSVTRGAILMYCGVKTEPDLHSLLYVCPKNGYVCIRLYDGRTGYIKRSYIEEYIKPIDADKLSELSMTEKVALRDRLVNTARSYLGTQYRWGGKTPLGIDCSGLTSMSYMLNGVYIYRDARLMPGFPVRRIPYEDMKEGDLLYFPGHIAMYIGDDVYIHSTARPGSDGVVINSLNPDADNYRRDLAESLYAVGSVFGTGV